MKMAGIGTVTWVNKDRFLAFGHPFMGLGQTEIPVSYANIVTTVASEAGSWKLGRPIRPAGTLTHDRIFAIGGQTGLMPTTVPLEVSLEGPGFGLAQKQQNFKYQLANHPNDVPIFAAIVSANTMENRNIKSQGGTLRVNGTLKLSNGRTVPVNETIVRHKSSLAMPAAFALLRQIEEVLNITLADVQLMGVNLRFVHSDALEAEELQSVRWNGAMHAGDKVKIWLRTKPFQQETKEEAIHFTLPKGLDAGTYDLEVHDRFSFRSFARMNGLLPEVDNYDAFLKQQANLPAADEMTVVLVSKKGSNAQIGTENIYAVPKRLQHLMGKGAGSVNRRWRGQAIELGAV